MHDDATAPPVTFASLTRESQSSARGYFCTLTGHCGRCGKRTGHAGGRAGRVLASPRLCHRCRGQHLIVEVLPVTAPDDARIADLQAAVRVLAARCWAAEARLAALTADDGANAPTPDPVTVSAR